MIFIPPPSENDIFPLSRYTFFRFLPCPICLNSSLFGICFPLLPLIFSFSFSSFLFLFPFCIAFSPLFSYPIHIFSPNESSWYSPHPRHTALKIAVFFFTQDWQLAVVLTPPWYQPQTPPGPPSGDGVLTFRNTLSWSACLCPNRARSSSRPWRERPGFSSSNPEPDSPAPLCGFSSLRESKLNWLSSGSYGISLPVLALGMEIWKYINQVKRGHHSSSNCR